MTLVKMSETIQYLVQSVLEFDVNMFDIYNCFNYMIRKSRDYVYIIWKHNVFSIKIIIKTIREEKW